MKQKRGKKNQRFSLREEYKKSWDYIRDSRSFIYFVIISFFILALVAFFFNQFINNLINSLLGINLNEQILGFLEELLAKTQNMSQLELIKFIFFNNLSSSFFGMVFGAALGIFPLISIITNGYLLGLVSSMASGEGGLIVLFRLLPHGIFELPAVFISLGLGLKLSTFILQKNKGEAFRDYLWNSLRVFILIVIPLLIIAAIIEGSLI